MYQYSEFISFQHDRPTWKSYFDVFVTRKSTVENKKNQLKIDQLKERLSFKQFNTVNELFEAAKTEWMNIDTKYIKKLYESISSRVRKVISHKGGCTRY